MQALRRAFSRALTPLALLPLTLCALFLLPPVALALQTDATTRTPEENKQTTQEATDPPEQAGQPQPEAPPALTIETVRQRLERVQQDESLDPAVRASIIEALQQAIDTLTQVARNGAVARGQDFERRAAEAPGLAETLREELSRPPAAVSLEIPPDETLQQMESRLEAARAELAEARRVVADLAAEPETRATRRTAINERLASIQSRLDEIEDALDAPPAEEVPAALAAARRTALQAERESLLARRTANERELAFYKVADDLQLLSARRDQASRRVARAEQTVEQLQELVATRRAVEARRAREEAARLQREAARAAPALQDIAAQIETIAAARVGEEGMTSRLAEANRRLSAVRQELSLVETDFRNTVRRIEVGGMGTGIGFDLRLRYQDLAEFTGLEREIREREREYIDVQFRLIDLEERYEQERVSDVERGVQALLEREGLVEATGPQREEFERVARELLTQRRELMTSLIDETRRYAEVLQETNAAAAALSDVVDAYRDYIDERILWVRSTTSPFVTLPGQVAEAFGWLINPDEWRDTLRVLARDIGRHPLPAFGPILLAISLLLAQRRIGRRLRELAPLVKNPQTDRYRYTIEALALTLLRAAALPTLIWLIGWRLETPPAQTDLGIAVGKGLQHAAGALLVFGFIARLARPDALFIAHFRWPENAVRELRKHLHWLIPAIVPLAGVVETMSSQPVPERTESLGRLAHMAVMALTTIFVARLLAAKGPIVQEYLKRHRGSWIDRLSPIWRPAIVLTLVSLFLLSTAGFYYTALQIGRRIFSTALVIVFAVVANSMLLRWLAGVRRRLAFERYRARQEAAAAEKSPAAGDAPVPPPPDHEIDISSINVQTRKVFRSLIVAVVALGLFAVWADVLPALRMLDRVQLYPQVRVVESTDESRIEEELTTIGGSQTPEQPTAADAEPADAAPQLTPLFPGMTGMTPATATDAAASGEAIVTLADLGLALILVIITWILARNVPGLLEITLLQRLPLETSARFAITTVARYIIVIVGGLAAFSAVNIGWSNIQWLAAALTFGLAFGLQEIFANFVSGLIILAERPMRVGDTVTVGDVSGTVTQIRMRATTIVDWDRKELIVPNKSFITNQLINWTLTDPVLRVTVPVGVAYGSDIDRVRETLLRVARESGMILEEPKPLALFLGFGDSTLNFELRAFIPSIDTLLSAKSELHFAIDKAFRAENITIAFPQRDLHIKTGEGLAEAIRQARPSLPNSSA